MLKKDSLTSLKKMQDNMAINTILAAINKAQKEAVIHDANSLTLSLFVSQILRRQSVPLEVNMPVSSGYQLTVSTLNLCL